MAPENITFDDPELSGRRLARLLERGGQGLAANFTRALSESAEPDVVLVAFERFLDATDAPDAVVERLGRDITYARLLATLFDQSHFLTDIMCRRPEYVPWLVDEAEFDNARPRDEIAAEMMQWLEGCDTIEACGRVMRQYRQREILRIAAREVFVHVPLASLTEDLSNLADAALDVAIRVGSRHLELRYGKPVLREPPGETRDAGFAVIGMGKLGGRELNFSSDIDLLFLYADETETTGGTSGTASTLDYFHKLGEHIIKLVSEQTAEGHLFRIDMRLRPYGRTSPLAISLARALEYYSAYAQAWERQALIKARPCAGDLALGERFIEATRPFVFPRYFDDATLDEIRQIKQQTEAIVADKGQAGIEVKLGRGGIRDIEFTVQMLQMLNGGRMPDLRTRSTLDAIRALGLRGHLSPFEATALASHYTFLRGVEHRLQIEGSQQRHVLPPEGRPLDRFARRLGYKTGDSFMAGYRDKTREARAILDKFLTTEGAGTLWTYDLLSPQAEGRIGIERLVQYGFRDPQKARAELIHLSAGPEDQPYPFHVRQQFAAIAPALLDMLAESGDPDANLVRLGRILANLRAPGSVYETLKSNPPFCHYLVTLVSNSEYLTEILIRDPGLFDVFGSRTVLDRAPSLEELRAQLALLRSAYDPAAAPYRFRDEQVLRVGMRELFAGASVVEIGQELTRVAEVLLEYALEQAQADVVQRHGPASGPFAILALGKFGGGEMGYGSDLDLTFVYGSEATIESGMAPSEYYAALASRVIQCLKGHTRYGTLYDIDARLRPDGKKGVLAVSRSRLSEYYLTEAQAWERLALIKARAVAGDLEFANEVETNARDIAFSLPLTPESLAEITEIRRKIVHGASPHDLKKAEGGLTDLEFIVRLLQLRNAVEWPDLKRGDVVGALDVLGRHQLLPEAHWRGLHDAYLLLRRIENRIRMMHGRSESTLPDAKEDLDDLSRRLDMPDVAERVRETRQTVRAAYDDASRLIR
ncbi:MAG TPA: bifunctional [glutamate--ammonia ligase]-adenylyl-L-tyrosine phosphorylase/[glutamate--ammonia-ligase] adenylyltransferase [Candidatus Bathyarchaeia archaeon]|nr:bifunctional [glutamate--ammonia ligase]-adenylyl-L-tyrosine phosphorylase/[glutamate--ammonia-ligase] adenylyltransferase [Candidatus Bathyarchaeia archaeon]